MFIWNSNYIISQRMWTWRLKQPSWTIKNLQPHIKDDRKYRVQSQKTRTCHTNNGPPSSELFLHETKLYLVWAWLFEICSSSLAIISTFFFLSAFFNASFSLPSDHRVHIGWFYSCTRINGESESHTVICALPTSSKTA